MRKKSLKGLSFVFSVFVLLAGRLAFAGPAEIFEGAHWVYRAMETTSGIEYYVHAVYPNGRVVIATINSVVVGEQAFLGSELAAIGGWPLGAAGASVELGAIEEFIAAGSEATETAAAVAPRVANSALGRGFRLASGFLSRVVFPIAMAYEGGAIASAFLEGPVSSLVSGLISGSYACEQLPNVETIWNQYVNIHYQHSLQFGQDFPGCYIDARPGLKNDGTYTGGFAGALAVVCEGSDEVNLDTMNQAVHEAIGIYTNLFVTYRMLQMYTAECRNFQETLNCLNEAMLCPGG